MEPESRRWGTHPVTLFWRSITIVYEELFTLVLLSVLTWVGIFLIVPSFPALAALFEAARKAIDGRHTDAQEWWGEWRRSFLRAWAFGGAMLLLTAVLAGNVWFYARQGTTAWRYVSILWIWLLLVWGLAALHAWPLFVLQEDTRLWMVLRNAIYLAFLRPVQTLVAALLLLLTTGVSLVLPIFLLVLPALWAVYTTLLTRQLVLSIQKGAGGK